MKTGTDDCIGMCDEGGIHPEDVPDTDLYISAIEVAEMLIHEYGASAQYYEHTWFKPIDAIENHNMKNLIVAMRQVESRERRTDVDSTEAESQGA